MANATRSSTEHGRTAAGAAGAYRMLVVLTRPGQERHLCRYVQALAGRQSVHLGVLPCYDRSETEAPPDVEIDSQGRTELRMFEPGGDLTDRVMRIAESWPFDMIVADWPGTDDEMGVFAALVSNTNATAVLIRHRDRAPGRVLVPTGGGFNARHGVRIAEMLAKAWSLKAEVLRILQPGQGFWTRDRGPDHKCRNIREATRLYLDVDDDEVPVKVRLGRDAADDIVCRCRQDDVVVIGGPGQWLMARHASSSIPGRVVRGADCSVVMVLANYARPSVLTDVFWDRMVLPGLDAADKHEAVELLVDAIIKRGQAPPEQKDQLLAAATRREDSSETCVAEETAAIHAKVPEFRGLAGMLGVFPEGVPFGDAADRKVRFLFLLLTSTEGDECYRHVLKQIVNAMADSEKRRMIARSTNSGEIVDMLASDA